MHRVFGLSRFFVSFRVLQDGHNFAENSINYGCRQKSLTQIIIEFRALQAKDAITPESLGYILQRIVDFRHRRAFLS